MISRRRILQGSLGAAAATAATPSAATAPRDIAISSSNGLACCRRVIERLQAGNDTLDAVVAGVNLPELDPEDAGVGYGGLPNEAGVVELDACVMHVPSRRAGSVASLRGIKTPSNVAQLVMERTDHIMLVGEGALQFAKAHGFQEEDLLTDKARLAWLTWKESLKVGIRLTQVAPISCGSLPANPSDPSALLWGGHHEQRFVLQLATAQALFESAEVAFIDCHSPGQQIPSRCPARSSPRSPRFGTHTQRTAAALFAKATTFHNRNSDSGNRPVSAAGTDTPDRPPHSQNGPRTPSSSEGNLPAPGILHIGAT